MKKNLNNLKFQRLNVKEDKNKALESLPIVSSHDFYSIESVASNHLLYLDQSKSGKHFKPLIK